MLITKPRVVVLIRYPRYFQVAVQRRSTASLSEAWDPDGQEDPRYCLHHKRGLLAVSRVFNPATIVISVPTTAQTDLRITTVPVRNAMSAS